MKRIACVTKGILHKHLNSLNDETVKTLWRKFTLIHNFALFEHLPSVLRCHVATFLSQFDRTNLARASQLLHSVCSSNKSVGHVDHFYRLVRIENMSTCSLPQLQTASCLDRTNAEYPFTRERFSTVRKLTLFCYHLIEIVRERCVFEQVTTLTVVPIGDHQHLVDESRNWTQYFPVLSRLNLKNGCWCILRSMSDTAEGKQLLNRIEDLRLDA